MLSPFLTEPVALWEYLSLHTHTQECCKFTYICPTVRGIPEKDHSQEVDQVGSRTRAYCMSSSNSAITCLETLN